MGKRNFAGRYAAVVSTAALFIALGGGAYALSLGKNSVGAKQIKRNAVAGAELKRNAVKSGDIGEETVVSSDIGDGQVLGQDLSLPPPTLIKQSGEIRQTVGTQYQKFATLGSFQKTLSDTVLSVTWSGTVASTIPPCIWQLRVDGGADDRGSGQALGANGFGESVSVAALFSGVPAGTHEVEVWARAASGGDACVLSPSRTGIGQTVVVEELVV